MVTGASSGIGTLDAMSVDEGADTLVWLATAEAPGTSTGGYLHKRRALPTGAAAQDDAAAERLWRESEALVARSGT